MVRRVSGLLCVAFAAVVAWSAGSAGSADAAPGARLKQFRVPTADSQPRAITTGADGNRWFTEGTESTNAPPTLARITPSGAITEFPVDAASGCNFCILTDIAHTPGGVLYLTSNDPTLVRFDIATQSFQAPVQLPNTSALGGDLAIRGDAVWVTDFNNDVVWRYSISTGVFTSVPATDPSDVAVDAAGNAWFTEPGDVNAPGTSTIGRIDAVTFAVTRTPTTAGSTTVAPHQITVATDGQVWFTARFTPQAVGRLNPADSTVTLTPLSGVGPEGIAASPDGSVWFTQETRGNIANITSTGTITEGKAVKGSGPFGVAVAADGHPWYTMMLADRIGTLQ
jgi:virginiamycin B lyase